MFRNPIIDAAVILLVVLLVMGPKRLPGLGKGLGQGMREFKDGITGDSKDDDPSLTSAQAHPETRSEQPADSSTEQRS